jgi:hypothetical protein
MIKTRPAADFTNQLPDLRGLVRVETTHRFVEDQHRGLVNQGLRETDALAETFRQLADALADHLAQARLLGDLSKPSLQRRAPEPTHPPDKLEILQHEHLGVERCVFGQVPDRFTHGDRVVEDVCTSDARRPFGGRDEACEYLHRRGFPGAIGA